MNRGHGQSQATQTASDPEKHPLPSEQSVTALWQAWPMHKHIHKHALSADYVQEDKQICLSTASWLEKMIKSK